MSGCTAIPDDSVCSTGPLAPNVTECQDAICNATSEMCEPINVTDTSEFRFLATDFDPTATAASDSDGTILWPDTWMDVGTPANDVFFADIAPEGNQLRFEQIGNNAFPSKCLHGKSRALPILPASLDYEELVLQNTEAFQNRKEVFFNCPTSNLLPLLPSIVIEASLDGVTWQYLGCIGGNGGGPCGAPDSGCMNLVSNEYRFDISFLNNGSAPAIRIMNGHFANRCQRVAEMTMFGPFISDYVIIGDISVTTTSACDLRDTCAQSSCVDGECVVNIPNDKSSFQDEFLVQGYIGTTGSINWALVGPWTETLDDGSALTGNMFVSPSGAFLIGAVTAPAFQDQSIRRGIPVPMVNFFLTGYLRSDLRPRAHGIVYEIRYSASSSFVPIVCVEGTMALGQCALEFPTFTGMYTTICAPVSGQLVNVDEPFNALMLGIDSQIRVRQFYLDASVYDVDLASTVQFVQVELENRVCRVTEDQCVENRCFNGSCVQIPNTTRDCDDGLPCTQNLCNATLGCVNPIATNFTCTVPGLDVQCVSNGTCDVNGTCVNFTVTEFAPCNSSNVCTLNDTCSAGGLCVDGNVTVDCDDGNNCTLATCDPEFQCVYSPVDPSDGVICTRDECQAPSGNITNIPDDTLCTIFASVACAVATCNPTAPGADAEGCTYALNSSFCSAVSPATCLVATCDPMDPGSDSNGCIYAFNHTACNDNGDCSTDLCAPSAMGADPITGCLNLDNPLSCQDNFTCTSHTCVSGTCTTTANNATCQALAANCQLGICDTTAVGTDPTTGCIFIDNPAAPCGSNVTCELAVCNPSSIFADGDGCVLTTNDTFCEVTEGDPDQCSVHMCSPGAMNSNPLSGCETIFLADGMICDDGDPMTVNECMNGTCVVVTGCTMDSECQFGNDTDLCTINDTCVMGNCVPGPPRDCEALLPVGTCMIAMCNSSVDFPGEPCYFIPNDTVCDTGNQCQQSQCNVTTQLCNPVVNLTGSSCTPTTNISCQTGGICAGSFCMPVLNDSLCDDGRPCTNDTCDLATMGCLFTPLPNGTLVGSACDMPCFTNESCDGNGNCTGIPTVCPPGFSCNVTTDMCEPPPGDECTGIEVGTLCSVGFCFEDQCIPCPTNDTCDGLGAPLLNRTNVTCEVVSSLVCRRLSRDFLSVSLCLNGGYLPNGTLAPAQMSVTSPLSNTSVAATVGDALQQIQQILYTEALLISQANNCSQLIDFLTSVQTATSLFDQIIGDYCPDALFDVVRVETWPTECYFGAHISEDLQTPVTDVDYNDLTSRLRTTHGFDSNDELAGALLEFVPVSRGTFYTHTLLWYPDGSVDAPLRLLYATTPPYRLYNGTARIVRRSIDGVTLAPSASSTAYGEASEVPIYADSATVVGPSGTALSLSQRIVNTRPLVAQQPTNEAVHLTASVATRAAHAAPYPPNPYDTPYYFVQRKLGVSAGTDEFSAPQFDASTGAVLNALDCAAHGQMNAAFVSVPYFRWPTERTALVTLCPDYAACVTCTCVSGAMGCRQVCEQAFVNCSYSNAVLAY